MSQRKGFNKLINTDPINKLHTQRYLQGFTVVYYTLYLKNKNKTFKISAYVQIINPFQDKNICIR